MNELTTRTKDRIDLWFRVAGIVFVMTALVAFLSGFYSRKFHLETGEATWIWIDHPLEAKQPIAFFAIRDVDVPPAPPFVRLRIACDADWTFWLNGVEIAGGSASSSPQLRVFDLTEIARKGERNRFAVALRSATGAGGLLASIDYAPLRENDVVTNASWTICRAWSSGVTGGETACDEKPLVLGTPPFGRWNYPDPVPGTFYSAKSRDVVLPSKVVDTTISRREIRVIDGLAVESTRDLPARRNDFDLLDGRGRVTLPAPAREVTVVEARYAEDAAALGRSAPNTLFVFAPGESIVTDPVSRSFRFLAVANPDAKVTVVPEPTEDTRD